MPAGGGSSVQFSYDDSDEDNIRICNNFCAISLQRCNQECGSGSASSVCRGRGAAAPTVSLRPQFANSNDLLARIPFSYGGHAGTLHTRVASPTAPPMTSCARMPATPTRSLRLRRAHTRHTHLRHTPPAAFPCYALALPPPPPSSSPSHPAKCAGTRATTARLDCTRKLLSPLKPPISHTPSLPPACCLPFAPTHHWPAQGLAR